VSDSDILAPKIREAQRFGLALRKAKNGPRKLYDDLCDEFVEFLKPLNGKPHLWQPVYLAYYDMRFPLTRERK
jgi:hypothetical protein